MARAALLALPAATFWLAWAGAHAWLHRTPWLALTAQLWIAYSPAWLALRLLADITTTSLRMLVATTLAGTAIGTALGLPLACDFDVSRVAAASWWWREGALPAAFALAMHLPVLLARSLYGKTARLDVVANEPRGVAATIRLPLPS